MAEAATMPSDEDLEIAQRVIAWMIDDVREHVPQAGHWITGLRVAHAQIMLTITDREEGH